MLPHLPTTSIILFNLCDVKYQGHTRLGGNSVSCLLAGHRPGSTATEKSSVNKLNLTLKQTAKWVSAEYTLNVCCVAETTLFQIHLVHNSVPKQIEKIWLHISAPETLQRSFEIKKQWQISPIKVLTHGCVTSQWNLQPKTGHTNTLVAVLYK